MNSNTIEGIDYIICTGCGLCSKDCPTRAISMDENSEGFRFPRIDSNKCIKCGKCLRDCPAIVSNILLYQGQRKYYSGIIKDKDLLLKSSSGGVFGLIAKEFVRNGGFVCGCVYNEKLEAVHILTNKPEEIELMYGSKYVQSRAEDCFPIIKTKLQEGTRVLFSGTACQVAAIRQFMNRDYENLLCVEILCHGVPSPSFFRSYKEYLEDKLHGSVIDIRFRDKRRGGWGSEHRTCVIYKKQNSILEYRPFLPAYFSAFFYGLDLRESCYNCKFARIERAADITIGDFWGSWVKYGKRFDEGISVIGLNNEKAYNYLNRIRDQFELLEELNEQEAICSNDNFTHPIKRPKERNSFYEHGLNRKYNGAWKKVYSAKTYKKKILASFYGALVPAKIRFGIQKLRSIK